jgi:asparagine synthase (glutamine-hydrolysing)
MCGDVRRVGGGAPDVAALGRVTRAMAHRGPDDEGIFEREGVALGHRRLSILDLKPTGHEPMIDAATGVSLSYNGETYNFLELRPELERLGHRFASTGDAEVVLRGYPAWGVDVLSRLNGMYAFVIHDPRDETMFLARDPMGQKPLLYFHHENGLLFASELAALMEHPLVPRRLDRAALAHYLVYESYVAPFTAIEGVRKLPPGHALRYHRRGGRLELWRHWDPIGVPPSTEDRPPGEVDERALEDVLRGAVERHLRSDVPVGIYLSGGVDSSMMALLAADVLGPSKVASYTVAHSVAAFDESAEARATATKLGLAHHEMRLTEGDFLDNVRWVLGKLDEPLADPGLMAAHQVARFAARDVKVTIAGDGGDELFMGYEPFLKWRLGERLAAIPGRGALRALADLMPAQYGYMGLGYKAQIFLRGLDAPPALRNMSWLAAFPPEEAGRLIKDEAVRDQLRPGADGVPPVLRPVAALHAATADRSALDRLSLEYQNFYLTNCICNHTDKANMLVSVEARAPFLDNEVLRHVNALPARFKLDGSVGKAILRRYLARRLGSPVANKKKQGFTVPLALWLRGPMREMAERLLDPTRIAAAGLFDPAIVRTLLADHLEGRRNNYKKLWTLIVFEAWRERFSLA